MSASASPTSSPAPGGGLELVTLYPSIAWDCLGQVVPRGGGLDLHHLQRAYASETDPGRRAELDVYARPVWLPVGVSDSARAALAALLHTWRHLDTLQDPVVKLRLGTLYEAVRRQCPELIFEQFATRTQWTSPSADTRRVVDTWLSMSEVLLCGAARFASDAPHLREAETLQREFDALNPRWRAEYGRRWWQDSPRAALVALQRCLWTSDAAWERMMRAVVEPVERVGPANTAQFLYASLWRAWPVQARYGGPGDVAAKLALSEIARDVGDHKVIDSTSSIYSDRDEAVERRLADWLKGFVDRDSGRAKAAAYWRHQLLASQLAAPARPPVSPGPTL